VVFTETKLKGAFILTPERVEDERGFFARLWCAQEFEEHGLDSRLAQCSISFNKRKGTLRGMHYQVAPYEESKLVRCTRGAIYDVVLDLRPDSATFKQWVGVNLTADNREMLYVPRGCAHGFQTFTDESEVFYQISESYMPDFAAGVRWNDAAFAIKWPLEVAVISERDSNYADYQP